MTQASFAKLDPREEHFRIPSHHEGLSLFLRYLPALRETPAHKKVVLYVHGGTFPSGLSIAHRFDGVSWRDELAASGFHCWGLTSTASVGSPIHIQRWRNRRRSTPRWAALTTQAVSSSGPSVSFARMIA